MVRTKADSSARKAVAAKAPRKLGSSSSGGGGSSSSGSKGGYSSGGGGNPLRICPTPSWQKGIAEFYPKVSKNKSYLHDQPGSSKTLSSSGPSGSTTAQRDIVENDLKDIEMSCGHSEGKSTSNQIIKNSSSVNGRSENGESINEERFSEEPTKKLDTADIEPCCSTSSANIMNGHNIADMNEEPSSSNMPPQGEDSIDILQQDKNSTIHHASSSTDQPSSSLSGPSTTENDHEMCANLESNGLELKLDSSSASDQDTDGPSESVPDEKPCSSRTVVEE